MSIRDQLKRLGGESAVYGLGQVSSRAVHLLLVPVLTRVLARDAFGLNDLLLGYTQSVVMVLVFGMDAALARMFYDEPDREARVRMVSSSFAFRLAVGGSLAAALALAAPWLAEHLLGGAVYAKYLRIAALTLPFTLFGLFANDVLRVTFQPWKFVALNLAQTITIGGLTLWFVLVRDAGVVGALYGKLGGDALAAVLGAILCRHHLRPRFSRTTLRRMLAFGAPLVPVAFAYGLVGALDRWFLQRHASLAEVAVYGVGLKFFAVVTLTMSAFHMAFGPFAFSRARESDAPLLYARVLTLLVAVASFGALAAGLAAPAIIALLATREYADAALPALWLGFAAVAQGTYYVAGLGVSLSMRTHLLGWAAAGGALVSVIANAVLVPRFGAVGAAAATCLAHATATVLSYAIAQRVYPLPYRGARLALLFVAGLGLGLAAVTFAPAGAAGVAVRVAALAAYAALVWRLEVWRDRGAVRHRPDAPWTSSAGGS